MAVAAAATVTAAVDVVADLPMLLNDTAGAELGTPPRSAAPVTAVRMAALRTPSDVDGERGIRTHRPIPRAGAAQINLLHPVGHAPGAPRQVVLPRAGVTGSECSAGAAHQRRTRQKRRVQLDPLAVLLPVNVEPQIVYFPSRLQLDQVSAFRGNGGEGVYLNGRGAKHITNNDDSGTTRTTRLARGSGRGSPAAAPAARVGVPALPFPPPLILTPKPAPPPPDPPVPAVYEYLKVPAPPPPA